MKKYLLLLLMITVFIFSGCDSKLTNLNNGLNQEKGEPMVAKYDFRFRANSAALGSNIIYLKENLNDPILSIISIDVMAGNFTQLFGVAFEFNYNADVLTYIGMDKGPLFGSDEEAIYMVAPGEGTNNKLVIGISRKGKNNSVTGAGAIINLKFKVNAQSAGTSPLTFNYQNARDKTNAGIPNVLWVEGEVVVSEAK